MPTTLPVSRSRKIRALKTKSLDAPVALVLELVPLALELVPLALELVPLVMELVPLALELVHLALELVPLALELVPLALELVPLVLELAPLVLEELVPAVNSDAANDTSPSENPQDSRSPTSLISVSLLMSTLF